MPDKEVCTGCDVLISKEMGRTNRFPKKWIVNYCSHKMIRLAFISKFPYTPKWCPVKKKEIP